jgi:hypothetical protein
MNKLVDNEKLFAAANRKLTQTTTRLAPKDFPEDFVLELYCECANKVCVESLSIAYDEYKAAKDENIFIVKPEHYLPEYERLLEETPHYCVIQKKPEKLDKPFEA